VVIDADLDREDHGSIPATVMGKGLEPLDGRTDPESGGKSQKKNLNYNLLIMIIITFHQQVLP
jgi:hypothetical protein